MSLFSQKLKKEITQIRFRPNLQWFGSRFDVAHELENEYDEWRSDRNGNIALYSPSSNSALEIYTNHITHARESSFDSDDNLKHITKLSNKFSEDFNVKKIHRLGFRQTVIYEAEIEFNEIVKLLHNKLFTQAENHPQPNNPYDLTYVLDTLAEGIKTHAQLGPVKSEEGQKHFNSKFETEINLDTDNNLFVDIDISTELNLTTSNMQKKLEKIITKGKSLGEKYLSFLEN